MNNLDAKREILVYLKDYVKQKEMDLGIWIIAEKIAQIKQLEEELK